MLKSKKRKKEIYKKNFGGSHSPLGRESSGMSRTTIKKENESGEGRSTMYYQYSPIQQIPYYTRGSSAEGSPNKTTLSPASKSTVPSSSLGATPQKPSLPGPSMEMNLDNYPLPTASTTPLKLNHLNPSKHSARAIFEGISKEKTKRARNYTNALSSQKKTKTGHKKWAGLKQRKSRIIFDQSEI